MIMVDLDKLGPYKIISSDFMDKIFRKHCNKVRCNDCKYDKLVPYENCRTAFLYGHNLMKVDSEDRYLIISDEERYFIHNKNIYCANDVHSCNECRYCDLIYDKNGSSLGCTASRVIAHRIIKGEITKDQYVSTRR